jgi:hypothetical protein
MAAVAVAGLLDEAPPACWQAVVVADLLVAAPAVCMDVPLAFLKSALTRPRPQRINGTHGALATRHGANVHKMAQ